MNALVVYEPSLGATEALAESIGDALRQWGTVEVVQTTEFDPAFVVDRFDVLVVGGPSHGLSMSTASSRLSLARRLGLAEGPVEGIREWISGLRGNPHVGLVATFDTRVESSRHLAGSAARAAARALRRLGFIRIAQPNSFFVADEAGPLIAGEESRAAEWGTTLAVLVGAAPTTVGQSLPRQPGAAERPSVVW